MKKLILSVAVAALGLLQVNAQDAPIFGFAEGDVIVEGSVMFNSESDKANDNYKKSIFEFSPKVGYFLNDNFAVGLNLSVGSFKEEDDFTDVDGSSFGAGVYGRYYFLELGERFKTFTELGVDVNSIKDVETEFNVGLDLGLNYFVKENIALTFGLENLLSFTSNKAEGADDSTTEFGLNAGSVNNPFGGTANFGVLFKF